MKEKLTKYKNYLSDFVKNLPISYKNSFWLLVVITFVFALIFTIVPGFYNTFYNCNTDDVIQYYPYIAGFFEKIKTGTLSIYDTALFGGTSFFSGTYYIPIDIFLVIAFFLSFILGVYRAYFLSILLKIFCSSYVMYYVLKNHKVRPLVCFVVSLVYSMTGLMQAYFVFPVYLGIIFYAPIAMILVDMYLSKEKKYLSFYLIPIFVLQIVLFDYYLAYMLLAFTAIYFLYSLILISTKRDLLENIAIKNFINFFLLIFVGVFISAAILLPSALYILNETSRNDAKYDNLFYFTTWNSEKAGYVFSLRHYFTQLMNFYIPNNPHIFMLIKAGDYVREHATFYMTLGLYVYLIKSVTLGDKKSNLLRIFSISLNIMFLIPIFSMIFTAQKIAYVRWFFIPYIFNLLTACNAMNKCNFKLFEKKNSISNLLNLLLPIISLVISFSLVLFTLIKNPEYFIHYDATTTSDYFFKGILIPTLIFICIYIIIFVLPVFVKKLREYKTYYIKLIPLTILCELIFSTIIVVISIGSTSCENEYENSSKQVKHLRSTVNYDFKDGYRINLYTNQKCIANNNVSLLNVNCTNFFQSFYNTPLNSYMNDINDISSTNWSRRSIYGYSLINAPMYNNKYVITNSQSITSDYLLDEKVVTRPLTLSSKYYKKYDDYNNNSYYELTNLPNFIIYDSVYYGSDYYVENESTFVKDLSLLKYGYVSLDTKTCTSTTTIDYLVNNYTNLIGSLSNDEVNNLNSFISLNKAGLIKYKKSDVLKDITNSNTYDSILLSTTTKKEGSNYFIYDLSEKNKNVFDHDVIYAYPSDSSIASMDVNSERYWMYFSSSDYDSTNRLILNPFHYNVSYIKDLGYSSQNAPDKFYMRYQSAGNSNVVTLFGFDYDVYDNFVASQEAYQDRYYSLDSDKMTIKFTNDSKAKVIKTAYTYSKDWQIENNTKGYETVSINGGFLGVIVPEGISNVDISLRFVPKGYETGFKMTQIGVIIYASIISIGLMIEMKNKIGDSL